MTSRGRIVRNTRTLVMLAILASVIGYAAATSFGPAWTDDEAPQATEVGNHAPQPAIEIQAVAQQLHELHVAGSATGGGYSREHFGAGWSDADGTGCDTRADMLNEHLIDIVRDDECTVLSGVLPYEPYTGTSEVTFVRGDPENGLDVDHVVALGDAWIKGAQDWSHDKRREFTEDPRNLLLVDPGQNRAKGDADIANWLPPNESFWCRYVTIQITIKADYDLWVTPPERQAMTDVLEQCPKDETPRGAE